MDKALLITRKDPRVQVLEVFLEQLIKEYVELVQPTQAELEMCCDALEDEDWDTDRLLKAYPHLAAQDALDQREVQEEESSGD